MCMCIHLSIWNLQFHCLLRSIDDDSSKRLTRTGRTVLWQSHFIGESTMNSLFSNLLQIFIYIGIIMPLRMLILMPLKQEAALFDWKCNNSTQTVQFLLIKCYMMKKLNASFWLQVLKKIYFLHFNQIVLGNSWNFLSFQRSFHFEITLESMRFFKCNVIYCYVWNMIRVLVCDQWSQ